MGSFIGSVVLNTTDGKRASAFWRSALGYVTQQASPDFLAPPEWAPPSNTRHDHGAMHLHLDGKDKMHIDLWVDEGDDLESEVERLVALGAKRVDWHYPEDAQHVVLADPEGNLFCVCA